MKRESSLLRSQNPEADEPGPYAVKTLCFYDQGEQDPNIRVLSILNQLSSLERMIYASHNVSVVHISHPYSSQARRRQNPENCIQNDKEEWSS
jgi:hypothetical protein